MLATVDVASIVIRINLFIYEFIVNVYFCFLPTNVGCGRCVGEGGMAYFGCKVTYFFCTLLCYPYDKDGHLYKNIYGLQYKNWYKCLVVCDEMAIFAA